MKGRLSFVMVNSKPRGKFNDSKGLKTRSPLQGDPLSPFLFCMVVDRLGRLVDLAKDRRLFAGFVIGKEWVEVSHLQFANDILFFFN